MVTKSPVQQATQPTQAVIDWLLDSDPAIRWQVKRDLTKEPETVVATERRRVGSQGWGARLLALQNPDGTWGDGFHAPLWQSTLGALVLLKDMGLDPSSESAQKMLDLVCHNVTWGPGFGDAPFFEGEEEPCINGRVLALGSYFGYASDQLANRLLNDQLEDGGWNCEAPPSKRSSFNSTICVLEGLIAYEKARGATPAITEARVRAQEYLLERYLFRRLSTGAVISIFWERFSYPNTWHYDVLRGLDYLRSAGVEPEGRVSEAVELVKRARYKDGRWPLQNPHHDPVNFVMEGPLGAPSRWNTLHALRVLDWYNAGN
jgi:hypothetical protein